MALGDHLPLSESLGVFVGVAGFDWLADGRAELFRSIAVAVAAGAVLFAARRWRSRQRKD